MSADGNLYALATSFRRGGASILIQVVIFGVVVLAFGEINFSAKREQGRGIKIRNYLIPDRECGWPNRLRVDSNLQSIAIEKPATRLDLKVQRTN